MRLILPIRPEGSRLFHWHYNNKNILEHWSPFTCSPPDGYAFLRPPFFGSKFQRVDPPQLFFIVSTASNPLRSVLNFSKKKTRNKPQAPVSRVGRYEVQLGFRPEILGGPIGSARCGDARFLHRRHFSTDSSHVPRIFGWDGVWRDPCEQWHSLKNALAVVIRRSDRKVYRTYDAVSSFLATEASFSQSVGGPSKEKAFVPYKCFRFVRC